MRIAEDWKDYEVIATGDGEKLCKTRFQLFAKILKEYPINRLL